MTISSKIVSIGNKQINMEGMNSAFMNPPSEGTERFNVIMDFLQNIDDIKV